MHPAKLLLLAMLVLGAAPGCEASDGVADIQATDTVEIEEEDEGCGCPE